MAIKINKKIQQGIQILKECPHKIEWILLLIASLFVLFTMDYADFQTTMNWAYQNAIDILSGRFGGVSYYLNCNYGITLALLCLVWNFPFAIFTFGLNSKSAYYNFYLSTSGAIWTKLFLLLMTFFFCKAVYCIAKEIYVQKKKREWILLFLLSSALFFMPVIEISQCDIVELTVSLWGIYYYLKEDKKKFLMFFAIAIPMKLFPLMIFIPLVLLHEKKIGRIIVEGIIGGSVFLLNMIYRKISLGTWVDSFSAGEISTISTNSVETNTVAEGVQNATIFIESNAVENLFGKIISNIPMFVFLYILICILAYSIPLKENWKKWTIYLSALVYTDLLLFLDSTPYRMIMVLPFLVLLIFMNQDQDRLRLSMLLETLLGWAFVFICIFSHQWVVGGISTFDFLFLRGIEAKRDLATFLTNVVDVTGIIPYANSCVLACLIGILLINRPKKIEGTTSEVTIESWILWTRIGMIVAWTVFVLYVLLIRPL